MSKPHGLAREKLRGYLIHKPLCQGKLDCTCGLSAALGALDARCAPAAAQAPAQESSNENGLDPVRGMDAKVVRGEVGIQLAVNRFLGWRLPEDFSPDCYVTFDKEKARRNNSWPIGTNLLTADQARAMFQFVLYEAAQAPARGTPSPMMHCPNCGYAESNVVILQAAQDFYCAGCGEKRLSEYVESPPPATGTQTVTAKEVVDEPLLRRIFKLLAENNHIRWQYVLDEIEAVLKRAASPAAASPHFDKSTGAARQWLCKDYSATWYLTYDEAHAKSAAEGGCACVEITNGLPSAASPAAPATEDNKK